MSWSIKLDNTELNNSTYNVSKISDETTAQRELSTLRTDGIDGVVILDDRFAEKIIQIRGILVATNPATLQTAIDTLNELFSRKDVNLDITPDGGSIRRYLVRMVGGVEYNREHYHNDFVPFSARFFVAEGIGKNTSSTNALTVSNILTERSPTPTGSHSASFSGSAKPKPLITLRLDTIGKADLLTLTNDDDNKEIKIEIDGTFSNADEIIIDTEQQSVEQNGVAIPFRGEIPEYNIGSNDLHLDIQGATYIEDQIQTSNSTGTVVGNTGALIRVLSQSFVPSESGWLSRLKIWASKTGTPGSLQIRIFSDNGGRPFENLVSGASGFLEPHGSFGGAAEVTIDDSSPDYYLRAGVKYWLVFTTTNSSGNYYNIFGSNATDNYADGMCLKFDGSVTPPTDPADWDDFTGTIADLYFKTHQGQGTPADWQIDLEVDYTKRYL